nr:MAG: putative RNA-dependent RNA polymerase [Xiaogan botourmia-like virus 3]
MAATQTEKSKSRPVLRRNLGWFSDLTGSRRFERQGMPEIPLRRNRFEIDPDLEPAATADMREDKGKNKRNSADSTACLHDMRNRRKVDKIVRFLAEDRGLKPLGGEVPYTPCGSIRRSVSMMFPDQLSLADRLSIKTSQKCEGKLCDFCEPAAEAAILRWKDRRLQPADVDETHLQAFSKAFGSNVERGWNRRRTAYVPNGHACQGTSRCRGGNWVSDDFSTQCEVQLVYSSGKPRIVTLYSECNVRVLTPLHDSLYSFLRQRGWLLVGSPTDESIRWVRDGTSGPLWLSFDYESATDNIKTAYVQRAVEILIERGEGLSSLEIDCLRVMSRLDFGDGVASTGQPMGSPMSFPLLCLINKTVVDMSLSSLHEAGEIDFNEWKSHRCLINGDDLLTRCTSSGDLVSWVEAHGKQVGLVTNREKTMCDATVAEINSTAFIDCVEEKKTNVGALWMSSNVEDVVDFARRSAVTSKGLKKLVRANLSRLARAETKVSVRLPVRVRLDLAKDPKIRTALLSRPDRDVKKPLNLFPVETVPHGFALSKEDVFTAITERVSRIRELGTWRSLRPSLAEYQRQRKEIKVLSNGGSIAKAVRATWLAESQTEDKTLSCLVRYWELKIKERLVEADPVEVYNLPPPDARKVNAIFDLLKTFKDKRNKVVSRPTSFSRFDSGYVSLSDG